VGHYRGHRLQKDQRAKTSQDTSENLIFTENVQILMRKVNQDGTMRTVGYFGMLKVEKKALVL
jgi:hypothetical protein